MDPRSQVTYFAETDFRGKRTPFGIKPEDRAKHMYVIGKTGMGKSTLLENLAVQDIKNGNGMAFVDPHGKSAELLLDYIPDERINDVVYFAPFDLDYPIAFNVMEDVGKDQRHLVANGLMATFKKIWPDVWSGRMEYILSNTILALLEYPNSTLLGVNKMLSDKVFRDKVVNALSDPSVKSFWVDEFAKYNERYMQEATDAIKNKIGQFTSNPLIRNIIGQPKSSFDIRKMMDEKKILIINLSKGRVGEINANLIGGMIITKIYLAAMSRASASDGDMKKLPSFYLYVDEFQSFVNDSFADILAEARKYKLSLTIAHQYVEQMPETVRDAVFGNVGTTIAFRVGPFDAELLEKVFLPKFTAEHLVNLGQYQLYLTLMIDSVGSAPFSARSLPPIPVLEISNREKIIEASRANYAEKRDTVEHDIVMWHDSEKIVNMPAVRPPRPAGAPTNGSSMNRPQPQSLFNHSSSNRPPERRDESRSVAQQPSSRPTLPPSTSTAPISAPSVRPPEHRDPSRPEPVSRPIESSKPAGPAPMSLSQLAKKANPEPSHNKEELRNVLKDLIKKQPAPVSIPPVSNNENTKIPEQKKEVDHKPEVPKSINEIREEKLAQAGIPEDALRAMLDVKL